MIYDSNIIIYAAVPERENLRQLIRTGPLNNAKTPSCQDAKERECNINAYSWRLCVLATWRLVRVAKRTRVFQNPRTSNAAVSAISRVEVLGYHALARDEERGLAEIFEALHVLPVNTLVIETAIDVRRQRRMSLGDAIVAATALIHDGELATHNVRDFAWISGLRVLDPISSPN